MSTLLEAVSGDTFGGLSGYRRPTAGNPTRVPTNLPAFRGSTNTPGQKISAPAIKSSANRNNRGTNALIPYSRITTYDGREVGGRLPGDIIFMSAFAPNAMSIGGRSYGTSSGHDVFHYSRLTGLYGLNQILANIEAINGDGKLMNLYVKTDASKSVADNWVEVPNLNEFRLDGIVLSDDQPGVNHGSTSNELGQLFNISVQGPTPVNNGYVTERGHAMLSRPKPTMSAPPILITSNEEDEAEEIFEQRNLKLYRQPNEFIYSEQMFSRDVEPMDELFCALVATEYTADDASIELATQHDGKVNAVKTAATEAEASEKRAELRAFIQTEGETLTQALRARKVYGVAGIPFTAEGRDAAVAIYSFQYHLCTSARLIRLANIDKTSAYNLARNESWTTADGKLVMPIDHNAMREKGTYTAEQLCDANWMARVVGAWRVGNVIDTKATKMPFFEGGPTETGNRLTVNVGVRWLGWRELRRLYTANPTGPQVGSDFADPWTTMTQGSVYDLAEAARRVGAAQLDVPDRAVASDASGTIVPYSFDGAPVPPNTDDLLYFQWPAKPELQNTIARSARPGDTAAAEAATGIPQRVIFDRPRDDASGLRIPQDEYIGLKRKRGRNDSAFDATTTSEKNTARAIKQVKKDISKLEDNLKTIQDGAKRKKIETKLNRAKQNLENLEGQAAKLAAEREKRRAAVADVTEKVAEARGIASAADGEHNAALEALFANVEALGASLEELHNEVQAHIGAQAPAAAPAPAPAPAPTPVGNAADAMDAEPLGESADMETEMEVELAPEVPAPPAKKVRATAKTMTSSSVERARQRVQRVERDSPARESPVASPMPTSGAAAASPTRSPGGTGANVFARRRSTPSPSPDRPATDSAAASSALDDVVDAEASASAGPSGVAATGADAASVGDAEELVEPKQKKSRVRPTSDVFSSILGSSRDGAGARAEPLNPAHRGGEKFRRRKRG
jgi:hypothetical protein